MIERCSFYGNWYQFLQYLLVGYHSIYSIEHNYASLIRVFGQYYYLYSCFKRIYQKYLKISVDFYGTVNSYKRGNNCMSRLRVTHYMSCITSFLSFIFLCYRLNVIVINFTYMKFLCLDVKLGPSTMMCLAYIHAVKMRFTSDSTET